MTSFHFNDQTMQYEYKTNLKGMQNSYETIITYDLTNRGKQLSNKIKVVGSLKAGYIGEEDVGCFEDMFLGFSRERDLLMLDTNHWIHFTKPEETKNHQLSLFN